MRKYIDYKFLTTLMLLIGLMFMAMEASAASSWQSKSLRFSAIAGETLATGNSVCISGADGKAYKADANDASLRPAVGVIGKGGASGATVEIIVSGILAGQTSASPGARVFLSETAGANTVTAPTNAQAVGWVMPGAASAATSTTYFIMIQTPTSAGAAY